MPVEELIEKLEKYPKGTIVDVSATYDCGFGVASRTIQYIDERWLENNLIILCSDIG